METTLNENLEKSLDRKITPPNYDDVVLTEEEAQAVLREARKHKHDKQFAEDYNRRVAEAEKPPVMTSWTDYYSYIQDKAATILMQQNKDPKLFVGEGRQEVYYEICKYFTSDPDCEYDLKKGLLLKGNIGCGKSFFLKLCSNNPRKSFHIYDCVKLPGEYTAVDDRNRPIGEQVILRFRAELGPKAMDIWRHQSCGVLFDDLGWEEIVKHYGNEINVMERIISVIYSSSMPFSNYHATTNLTAEELEAKYGSRIASRMREMFNQIPLPGTDLRK